MTHQTDCEEHELEDPSHLGAAGDVTVAHRAHRHHQEVDRVPVGDRHRRGEVGQVPGVLKLTIHIGKDTLSKEQDRTHVISPDGRPLPR